MLAHLWARQRVIETYVQNTGSWRHTWCTLNTWGSLEPWCNSSDQTCNNKQTNKQLYHHISIFIFNFIGEEPTVKLPLSGGGGVGCLGNTYWGTLVKHLTSCVWFQFTDIVHLSCCSVNHSVNYVVNGCVVASDITGDGAAVEIL